MKLINLKPEDFPVRIRLQVADSWKDYVLVKTKQDKLLLNKPVDTPVVKERTAAQPASPWPAPLGIETEPANERIGWLFFLCTDVMSRMMA